MSDNAEDRIKQRAHQIWDAEGRPHGRDQEHWEQARREVAEGIGTGAASALAEAESEKPRKRPAGGARKAKPAGAAPVEAAATGQEAATAASPRRRAARKAPAG